MSDSDRPASDGELEEAPAPDAEVEEIPVSDGELEPESELDLSPDDRSDSDESLQDYGRVSDYDEDAPFVRPTQTYAESEDEVSRDSAAEDSNGDSDGDVVPAKKMKQRNRESVSSSGSSVVENVPKRKKKAKHLLPVLSGKEQLQAEALYNEQLKSGQVKGQMHDDQSVRDRQCPECFMICHAPWKLERHMKSHKNLMKADATCPLCKSDIRYEFNFSAHMRTCRPKVRQNFIDDLVKKNYPDFLQNCKDIVNDPEAEIELPEGYEMDQFGYITAVDVNVEIDAKTWFNTFGPEDDDKFWEAQKKKQGPATKNRSQKKKTAKLARSDEQEGNEEEMEYLEEDE